MDVFDTSAVESWVIMLGLLGFALWRFQKVRKQQLKRGIK